MSKRVLKSVCLILAAAAVLCSPLAISESAAGIDDWLDFKKGSSRSWEQPFDRSFARQWEAQPQRGYPTVSQKNIAAIRRAIKRYARIVASGGWKRIPAVEMRTGVTHRAVAYLRKRLEITGDLQQRSGYAETFDYYVEKAVKRAQIRHGLTPTGVVDKTTLAALNVPASARLRQLRSNLNRLRSLASSTAKMKRYVFVNIPAAQIEAVENGRVYSRHAAVVGKPERQTPILRSNVHEINFNKEWILPPTVIREDLIPKGRQLSRKGQNVLLRYGIDAYASYEAYRRGQKIDPRRVNWSSRDPYNYMYAQEAGKDNPLGFVKINFHNKYAVYMHDTPSKTIFGRNFRAESSGCVRVQGVQQLVAWLLRDNPGWDLHRINAIKRSGERLDVKLKKKVPLYFAYVTAWATPDDMVHFRRDVYRRDGVGVTASAY